MESEARAAGWWINILSVHCNRGRAKAGSDFLGTDFCKAVQARRETILLYNDRMVRRYAPGQSISAGRTQPKG